MNFATPTPTWICPKIHWIVRRIKFFDIEMGLVCVGTISDVSTKYFHSIIIVKFTVNCSYNVMINNAELQNYLEEAISELFPPVKQLYV